MNCDFHVVACASSSVYSFSVQSCQSSETERCLSEKWIQDKPQFDLEKIWEVREKCIFDLQN